MIRDKAIGGRLVQGLRTKYFPKSRINQGLIGVGPWVNILLLALMFVLLGSRLVVQSGYTVDLPEHGSQIGVKPALLAVVKHFSEAGGRAAAERVFFNDDSFVIGNQKQMEALRDRIREAAQAEDDASILLFSDKEISNDTLVRVFHVLREAGIESVSLAVSED